MAAVYLPTRAQVVEVARAAPIRNTHPDARRWLLDKMEQPPSDWDSRTILTVPGPVWTVSSDTCMTGHLSAPKNIAYDDYGREFVYRQPANAEELAAIMSADGDEVFACYRFDGLDRWSPGAVDAWHQDVHVIRRWIDAAIASSTESEIADGLRAYAAHLDSRDFGTYLTAFKSAPRDRPARRHRFGRRL